MSDWDSMDELEPLEIDRLAPAPADVDWLRLEAEDAAEYAVLLATNRGPILLELWPDRAPKHVRNFLDLSATGFYDGTTFHRVFPGFMIQGGDPEGTGNGRGPRQLEAEITDAEHRRGVLSMARGNDLHSASCQFFLMHADAPNLDGLYTAFGRMLGGFDALDRIANAPGTPIPGAGGTRPAKRQIIERARVVLAP